MNQIELSIEQKLSLAQSFVNHPVQGELIDYKIKYINVLEWFVNRFSPNDIFSKQLLGNYKVGLLGVEAINYQYNDNIEELLMSRYVSAKQRKSGKRTRGPAKRTDEVRNQFLKQLDKILIQA